MHRGLGWFKAMEKKMHLNKISMMKLRLWNNYLDNWIKPLIHGQINLIKLIWQIFWIKNCGINFYVFHDHISLKQVNQISFNEIDPYDL